MSALAVSFSSIWVNLLVSLSTRLASLLIASSCSESALVGAGVFGVAGSVSVGPSSAVLIILSWPIVGSGLGLVVAGSIAGFVITGRLTVRRGLLRRWALASTRQTLITTSIASKNPV